MSEPTVPVTFISPHAVMGGAEAVMRTLVLELGRRWVRGIVLLQDGPFVEDLRARGLDVCVIPTSAKRRDMLVAAVRLRRVLRAQEPHVVHANGTKAALVAGLATLGLPARLLWMKHDTAGDDGLLSRLVATRCEAIVGVSDTVLRNFGGRVRRRTTVVHDGLPRRELDREQGRRLVTQALGSPPEAPVVTLGGRLCVGKGQRELLAAASAMLDAHPDTRFALVGGDDPAFPGYAERLRIEARELGIEHAVTLVGWRADLVEFIAGSDIVVAPSVLDDVHGWREGFGLVPVEALQAGTPVVAYASGSLPEVLGNAAILVPEGDRAGLASAVNDLLEHSELRADLAKRGRARVAELYSLDRSIEAMREQYRCLTGSRP